MATKLEKPITITLESVEAAIDYLARQNMTMDMLPQREVTTRAAFGDTVLQAQERARVEKSRHFSDVWDAVKAQGIAWTTWTPPPRLIVAGRAASYSPDTGMIILADIEISLRDLDALHAAIHEEG